MKIIHCADIHADSKMESNFSKEQAKERRGEIVGTFAKMVEFAGENGVKVIIIAGDLFDTKTSVQKSIKASIADIISRYSQIDFLYLRGNHDEDTDFATDEKLPNLKRFSKEKWTKYSYGNVEIYGREFGKSQIPVSAYSELVPDLKKVNIITLHGNIKGGDEKDGAPDIMLEKLMNQKIDYVALGHIHKYGTGKLDLHGNWCYPGCLEGRGFDECGEKGFVLLDINDENGQIATEFVTSCAKRRIHEIEVALNGAMSVSEIKNKIKESSEDVPGTDIVRILLKGDVSEETKININEDFFREMFSRDFYFIDVKDKTRPEIDYKNYENDISLKGEFIRLVKEQADLSDDEKIQVIMTGIKALQVGVK